MDARIQELQRANDTLRCPLQDTDARRRQDAQAAFVATWRTERGDGGCDTLMVPYDRQQEPPRS